MKPFILSFLLLSTSVQAEVLNINKFSLDKYKGNVVYLDFWASWCKPCQASFPWMNRINKQYKDQNFKVVTINLDEDTSAMNNFLSKIPADFAVYHDPSGSFAEKFKLEGMPTSYLINKSGQVVKKHIGFYLKNIDAYEQEIEALL